MIISSLIKNSNAKDLVKLLSAENKQIIFLISVGQSYHEGEELQASVQVLYDLIDASAAVIPDLNADPRVQQRIHSPWNITVIVADTLQAYNHASDEASLATQQKIWDEKGNEWLKRNSACFSKLLTAGGAAISVTVQFKKWNQLLASGEAYHFQEYYQSLTQEYAIGKQSSLFLWVNHKSHRHAYRKSNPSSTASTALQEQWKNTALREKEKYKLKYILEELAILMGCIASGLINNERENTLNSFCSLLYPSNEEEAFRHARNLLKKVAESNQFIYKFHFHWHSMYLTQSVDPSFLLISNSDVAHYSKNELNTHQLRLREMVDKVYFDLSDVYDEKYHARFPKWAAVNYFKNRIAYKELANGAFPKFLLLRGGSGTGKASLVREFCANNRGRFSKFIWLERDNTENPYFASVASAARQFKLADAESDEESIQKAFRRFVNSTPGILIVFKNALNYSEIEEFMPNEETPGLVFITTKVMNDSSWFNSSWQNKLNYPIRKIEVKPFSIEAREAEQCFLLVTRCKNDPGLLTKICHHLDYLPALVHFAAVTYQQQSRENQYSLEEFYQSISEESTAKLVGEVENNSITKKSQMLWRNSLRFLESEEKKHFGNSMACRVLEIWSFLGEEINTDFFLVLFNPKHHSAPDARPPLEQFTFIFETLHNLALIHSTNSAKTFKLMKTLQAHIRQELVARKQRKKGPPLFADIGDDLNQWLNIVSLMVLQSAALSKQDKILHAEALQKNIKNISSEDRLMLLDLAIDSEKLGAGLYMEAAREKFRNFKGDNLDTIDKNYYLIGANQKAHALYNSGDYRQALTTFQTILLEQHTAIQPSPNFWSEIHHRCYVIHKLLNNPSDAKQAIENAIACTDHPNGRKYFYYRIEHLLLTARNKTEVLYKVLHNLHSYESSYTKCNNLDYANLLGTIGAYYLDEKPEFAEPFLLKSLDLQSKYYQSLNHIALCPAINFLSSLYLHLENYELAQFYAKKALIISFEKNDWRQDINAVSESLKSYFYASNHLNETESVQNAFILMVNFMKLVQATFPNGLPFQLTCVELINEVKDNPVLQNLNYQSFSIDHLKTQPGITVFKENCHYATAKISQLVSEGQVHHKLRFFSPSRYATPEQVFGPYQDYFCKPDDEITALSLLVNEFS